jgi:hypothetical protein
MTTRVLAFTCSRHRPLMLRHCIMQLQRQTYPPDQAIYVNSPDDDTADCTSLRYDLLLDDLRAGAANKIVIRYGRSQSYVENHLLALSLIDIGNYDLFLKIDDDFYLRHYVEEIVSDFEARRWDYSGTASRGLLNGRRWRQQHVQSDLGLAEIDLKLGVILYMPPTLALSRKAIAAIIAASTEYLGSRARADYGPDIYWRRLLAQRSDLVGAVRTDRNFVYNIHGGNVSTGTWLEP